jgi:hypothetical protein
MAGCPWARLHVQLLSVPELRTLYTTWFTEKFPVPVEAPLPTAPSIKSSSSLHAIKTGASGRGAAIAVSVPPTASGAGAGAGAGTGAGTGAGIGAKRTASSGNISAARSPSSAAGLVQAGHPGPSVPPRAPTPDSAIVQLQALDVFSILETLRRLGLHLPFLRIKLAVRPTCCARTGTCTFVHARQCHSPVCPPSTLPLCVGGCPVLAGGG